MYEDLFELCKGGPMLQHNGTDLIDRKILQQLSSDARLPVAELARRIQLSPSATAERVRRLESFELIRGYRADINLQALGFSIMAFVRLTCDGSRYRPFLKFLPTLDAVQECHHLTGGDAFLLKVMLSSVSQLEDLIEKLLPYGSPTTSMVLSTPLERKQISLLT
jgi:Lrp/AsnC family leucine-responsive transcriptional regulator